VTAPASPATPRQPDGVVALREPHDDDAIREVLLAYVRGFACEDIDMLTSLLTSDATDLGASSRGGRAAVVEAWQRRLRTLDYSRVAVNDVLRFGRLDRFDFEQLVRLSANDRPKDMRPGDLLVRVPVVRRAGEPRLFGDALVVLLRREQGQLAIAGVHEDDGP
jgi:hypothetical protein